MQIVTGSSDAVDATIHTVKQMIVHPNYDQESDSYNFALLKIKGSFTWWEHIGNTTLPSSETKNGTALVAAGYGDTVSCCTLYKQPQNLVTIILLIIIIIYQSLEMNLN